MTSLPKDWGLATLRELTLPVVKVDPLELGRETVRYIDIGSVDGARHALLDVQEIPAVGAPSRARQVVHEGDTVFSTVRPYLEKIAYVDGSFDGEFASTGFSVLRPTPNLVPKYLFYFSISRGMLDQVLPYQKGVSYPAVLDREVRETIVPVPPLDEQRRIVEILEYHLSRLDRAENLVRNVQTRIGTLLRSLLSAGLRAMLFDNDWSEGDASSLLPDTTVFVPDLHDRVWHVPPSWAWARLGDLFEVNIGTTPSRADQSLWDGDLPWISSGEVSFNRITKTRETIGRTAVGNSTRRVHPPGTVMLAMIGEGKTRGQCAILDIEAAHNQNCASIRVSATEILPEYVFGYLQERYFETRREGAGAQQPALNKGRIQRFAIPVPPLGTQRRLVSVWGRARDEFQRLDFAVNETLARSTNLRAALFSAAFSGRLTAPLRDIDPKFAVTGNDQEAMTV